MWTMVKTENPFTFANSVRLSVFRARTLSYSSVQVQSPIHSKHLRNIFFIRWTNQTANWFTKLAKRASNKQVVHCLEDPFILYFFQSPMVRPEMFVLLGEKKSFLHWEVQSLEVSLLCEYVLILATLECSFVFICEVSHHSCDCGTIEKDFYLSTLYFLFTCMENRG